MPETLQINKPNNPYIIDGHVQAADNTPFRNLLYLQMERAAMVMHKLDSGDRVDPLYDINPICELSEMCDQLAKSGHADAGLEAGDEDLYSEILNTLSERAGKPSADKNHLASYKSVLLGMGWERESNGCLTVANWITGHKERLETTQANPVVETTRKECAASIPDTHNWRNKYKKSAFTTAAAAAVLGIMLETAASAAAVAPPIQKNTSSPVAQKATQQPTTNSANHNSDAGLKPKSGGTSASTASQNEKIIKSNTSKPPETVVIPGSAQKQKATNVVASSEEPKTGVSIPSQPKSKNIQPHSRLETIPTIDQTDAQSKATNGGTYISGSYNNPNTQSTPNEMTGQKNLSNITQAPVVTGPGNVVVESSNTTSNYTGGSSVSVTSSKPPEVTPPSPDKQAKTPTNTIDAGKASIAGSSAPGITKKAPIEVQQNTTPSQHDQVEYLLNNGATNSKVADQYVSMMEQQGKLSPSPSPDSDFAKAVEQLADGMNTNKNAALAIVLSKHQELSAELPAPEVTKDNKIVVGALVSKVLNDPTKGLSSVEGADDYDSGTLQKIYQYLAAAKADTSSKTVIGSILKDLGVNPNPAPQKPKPKPNPKPKQPEHHSGEPEKPKKPDILSTKSYNLTAEQKNYIDSLDISSTHKHFLSAVTSAVMDGVLKGYRYNPDAVIAQAMLESRSGTGLSVIAQKGNNIFGSKGSYHGKSITANGTEQNPDGSWTGSQAMKWKDFPSINAAVNDYAREIGNLSWYEDAMYCNADPATYLRALENKLSLNTCHIIGSEPAWATDHIYKDKVMGLVKDLGIQKLLSLGQSYKISRAGHKDIHTETPAAKAAEKAYQHKLETYHQKLAAYKKHQAEIAKQKAAEKRAAEEQTKLANVPHSEYVLRVPSGGHGHDVPYVNQVSDIHDYDACGPTSLYTIEQALLNKPHKYRDMVAGLRKVGAYTNETFLGPMLDYAKNELGLKVNTINPEFGSYVSDADLAKAKKVLDEHKLILVHSSKYVSLAQGGETQGHFYVMYAYKGNNFYFANVGNRADSPPGGRSFSSSVVKANLDGFYVISN